MDRKTIAEKLRELAGKAEYRSKAAQLRDVMDEIEEAMARGVSRKAIVTELAKNGLAILLSTFDSILARHRKKHVSVAVPNKRNFRSHPTLTQNILPETDEPETPGTFNPAALDDIINSTPDLAEYARMAKENKRKKRS